jgi:hypothetical protein
VRPFTASVTRPLALQTNRSTTQSCYGDSNHVGMFKGHFDKG